MAYKEHPLLKRDINLLPFSASLKKSLQHAGIRNLKQLLKIPVFQWRQHVKGLTTFHWRKLLRFVVWNDMGRWIKDF